MIEFLISRAPGKISQGGEKRKMGKPCSRNRASYLEARPREGAARAMAGRLLQAAVWLGVSGLGGCATTGQVSVRDLPAQYEAQSVRPVKALDFAKLARPSEQQRHIQSGDLLEVTCSDLLAESKKETIPVRVDPDGAITLPLLPGTLRLDSLTCGEAEQTIETAYRTANLVRQPHVSIKTLEFSNKKIYVIGAVKKPGMYELRPDECNPLRAILAAEGVTEDAGSVVEIRRTGRPSSPPPPAPAPSNILVTGASIPTGQGQANPAGSLTGDNDVIRFDLADQGLNVRPDQLVLNNGDVVSVEERKKQPFFVTGSVNQPGQFPTPADREIHVLEAIGMAGGVNTLSQPTLALITRRLEGKPPVVLRVDLDRAARYPKENIRLMAGDVVTVQEDVGSQTRRFFREFIKLGINAPIPSVN